MPKDIYVVTDETNGYAKVEGVFLSEESAEEFADTFRHASVSWAILNEN